ncbi:putative dicarboxylate carrier protein [Salinisphaera hydrothermalis C41B8]|uniref:Putative dicarboxylate carrier protein n=2 Tax=Salinisphaera TaxID=180541 RepID=A0A084IL87_SALHC|nr:putative dicarboxylate carrier protein [Salinisphaera hydrothermalis C41B8]
MAVGISIWRSVNLGIIAFAAVFLLGAAAGIAPQNYLTHFPADLCLLIIGVTMLFAHAERSGAIEWLLSKVLSLVGKKSRILIWVPFALGAVLSAAGGFPGAVVAIVTPVAAKLSRASGIDYMTVAILGVWGATSGAFSPISPYGAALQTAAERANLAYNPWVLFGAVLAVQLILAVLTSIILPRVNRQLDPKQAHLNTSVQNHDLDAAETQPSTTARRAKAYCYCSLAAILIFVGLVAAFPLDIGLVALALSLALQLVFHPDEKAIIRAVPWAVILLLSGLLVYIGVLGQLGTINALESILEGALAPVVSVLLVIYLTAVIGNIDSSTLAVLTIAAPLALTATGHIPAAGLAILTAIGVVGSTTTISPVHVGGAMIMGNATAIDDRILLRRLFGVVGFFTVVLPALVAILPIFIM